MSSFVRRMQLAAKRRSEPPRFCAGPNIHFGSQLGVVNSRKPKKNQSRGSRRGKRSKAYIERRKALRLSAKEQ